MAVVVVVVDGSRIHGSMDPVLGWDWVHKVTKILPKNYQNPLNFYEK